MKLFPLIIPAGVILAAGGCWTLTVKHKIDPIYITMDVNVKAEEQLNDFFDYENTSDSTGAKTVPADTTLKK